MAEFGLVCPVHGSITPRDIAVYGLDDVDAQPHCRLPVVTREASGRPTRIDWCGEPLATVPAGGPVAPGWRIWGA